MLYYDSLVCIENNFYILRFYLSQIPENLSKKYILYYLGPLKATKKSIFKYIYMFFTEMYLKSNVNKNFYTICIMYCSYFMIALM